MKENIRLLIFAFIFPILLLCIMLVACNPNTNQKVGKSMQADTVVVSINRICNIQHLNWTVTQAAYQCNAYLMSDDIDTEIVFQQNMTDNK